jgi:hypothetical protein
MTGELWLEDIHANRGLVTIAFDTLNQDGEVRQSSKVRVLASAKPQ